MKNKSLIPIIIGIFTIVGVYVGHHFGSQQYKQLSLDSFLHRPQNKLVEVINYIDYNYVDEVQKEDLMEGAINHLLEKLDPHSYYIASRDLEMYNEPLEGNFEGIGVKFRILKDTVTVIQTIARGPSEKSGVMAGDRIVTVDDSLIAGVGVDNETIMKLLKGPRKTEVVIGVQRGAEKELRNISITRDRIDLQSVEANYLLSKQIGYLKLGYFAKKTGDEVLDSIRSLRNQGMKGLVLDLRGNGGGILQSAIQLARAFLPKEKLIVYTEGRNQPRREYWTKEEGEFAQLPLAILIDEASASASEILSGALQDHDRGVVIGRRSFGKGLVQEQVELTDRSALRLTVARYYTPTGRSIQKPYKGNDEYEKDLRNRYEQGELFSADSVVFNDSLIFTTPAGDTVYGGGGIMPDIFIPLRQIDTNNWYSDLFYSGELNQFTFDLSQKYRGKYTDAESFMKFFAFDKGDLKELERLIGRKIKDRALESENRLKAFIARNLFDENAFFQLWNADDPMILKAMEVVEEELQNEVI